PAPVMIAVCSFIPLDPCHKLPWYCCCHCRQCEHPPGATPIVPHHNENKACLLFCRMSIFPACATLVEVVSMRINAINILLVCPFHG
ncbi:MAG TPA: hypothetical protein VNL70_02660, partial [Tepidisphaeraceae bacterium]|nr:hypothetical protein [Tepidisphaeraceae bacterium]